MFINREFGSKTGQQFFQAAGQCLARPLVESLKIERSVQFSSVAQLSPTLCDPMDCSMPGFSVHHHLEPTQTPAYRVGDAIQPSHPLSSASPSTFHLSQHQGLFQ